MKIAISSSGKTLESTLDPRFGRCACFLIVDPENMSFEAFDNQSAALPGGAGIQAAQFLADQNVSAVITGQVGPNAVQALSASGIDIFAQQQGTVKEVIERYKSGGLKPVSQPTVGSHFGTGGGRGMGGGGGRGMGGGGGRGMGGGGGRGMGGGGGRGMRQTAGRVQGQGSVTGQGRGRRS